METQNNQCDNFSNGKEILSIIKNTIETAMDNRFSIFSEFVRTEMAALRFEIDKLKEENRTYLQRINELTKLNTISQQENKEIHEKPKTYANILRTQEPREKSQTIEAVQQPPKTTFQIP